MSGCSFDNCVSQDSQGYATMHSPQTQRLNTEDYFLSQNPLQLQATLQDIVTSPCVDKTVSVASILHHFHSNMCYQDSSHKEGEEWHFLSWQLNVLS